VEPRQRSAPAEGDEGSGERSDVKIRTFEYDDFPRDAANCLLVLDALKRRWPAFRATLFAIPAEMTRDHHRAVQERGEWLRLGCHGFRHIRRECRQKDLWERQLRTLDRIAKDQRWTTRLFKSPWTGYSAEFVQELHERGLAPVTKHYVSMPYPLPAQWQTWTLQDARMAAGWWDKGAHVEAHPIYAEPGAFKAKHSEISPANVSQWTSFWSDDDRWVFGDELIKPMCVKVNIGCERQILDGWRCLDNRQLDPRVIRWDALAERLPEGGMLPFGENKADLVCTSHFIHHLPEEYYAEFFLEVWRVLRPGAVYRLEEDATDSGYVWRRPGERARGTGTVRSLPTEAKVRAALARVGFEIREISPGKTHSPHADATLIDTRVDKWRKGWKFGLEAIKAIVIKNESHPRYHDPRATKNARYRLPALT
jgi:SAM-dependent methyltransferase